MLIVVEGWRVDELADAASQRSPDSDSEKDGVLKAGIRVYDFKSWECILRCLKDVEEPEGHSYSLSLTRRSTMLRVGAKL